MYKQHSHSTFQPAARLVLFIASHFSFLQFLTTPPKLRTQLPGKQITIHQFLLYFMFSVQTQKIFKSFSLSNSASRKRPANFIDQMFPLGCSSLVPPIDFPSYVNVCLFVFLFHPFFCFVLFCLCTSRHTPLTGRSVFNFWSTQLVNHTTQILSARASWTEKKSYVKHFSSSSVCCNRHSYFTLMHCYILLWPPNSTTARRRAVRSSLRVWN